MNRPDRDVRQASLFKEILKDRDLRTIGGDNTHITCGLRQPRASQNPTQGANDQGVRDISLRMMFEMPPGGERARVNQTHRATGQPLRNGCGIEWYRIFSLRNELSTVEPIVDKSTQRLVSTELRREHRERRVLLTPINEVNNTGDLKNITSKPLTSYRRVRKGDRWELTEVSADHDLLLR
jgi:hypothetical protein